MKRKLISLALVAAMTLSLSTAAFASINDGGHAPVKAPIVVIEEPPVVAMSINDGGH